MKAKNGITVFFTYEDMEYERDIESVTVYKNYSWFGDLGFGGNVAFTIHGDLDEDNQPIMQGLTIQVDSTNGNTIHEYIREGISFEQEKKLIPAHIDNKNVMKDWIEEIFDGGNCIANGKGMMTGFVNNDVCSCWAINNLLFWEISKELQRNGGESFEILIKRLREHDTPPLVIKYDDSMRDELFLCQKFYFEAE